MAQVLTKNLPAAVFVLFLGLAWSLPAQAVAGTEVDSAGFEEYSGPPAMSDESLETLDKNEGAKAYLLRHRLRRAYWFLDCKILLYYTDVWRYSRTGFWGGWYPYLYHSYYYYPWYGPIFCHPCCWRLPWHYWWWRWPWRYNCYYSNYWYQGCWWWWHPWRGGSYFYGFLNRLQYRYWCVHPRTVYWWSWYWWNKSKRICGCMEIVTLGDSEGGGRVLPLDNEVLDNYEVASHTFNVNGGKSTGSFVRSNGEEGLDRVEVANLPVYYASLGADANDVQEFVDSDVYMNLVSNSPPGAEIYVQSAEFSIADNNSIAELSLTESDDGAMEVTEGGQTSYEITLDSVPVSDVFVTVTASVSADKVILGTEPIYPNDPGEPNVPITLHYSAGDAGPKTVYVGVSDNGSPGRDVMAVLTHTVESNDPNYTNAEIPAVPIAVKNNGCGAKGYLLGDINRDCNVNFLDVVIIGNDWLSCTDPSRPECVAASGY